MPTQQAIVSTNIPKDVPKPIPVRTVSTRPQKINTDQQIINRSDAAEPAPEESVKLSPQLSAIARKEQAVRQRELALKAREEEMEAKLKDADQFSSLKTKLSAKDYSEAEALGLDYDAYTQYKVDKLNGEDPKEQKLKLLEDKIAALEKGKEESTVQAYEDTVSDYKKEIKNLVQSDKAFEAIKHLERDDAVLQLVLDEFEENGWTDKDGKTLSAEEVIKKAAMDVNAYLKEEAKKWEPLLRKSEPEEEPVEEKKMPPALPKTGLKTLTQQLTAGSEKRPAKSLQHLSEAERYAEARRRVLERQERN